MPSDPPNVEPGAAWHSDLADRDHAAHERMAEAARSAEGDVLRRRITALAAELAVLREAVAFRSRILEQQSLALDERETRIIALESELDEIRLGSSTRPTGLVSRARSVAGRLIRAARRALPHR